MSVSPLSFFRMLGQLDWEVIPGIAEKWGASQGTWGSKWEAPYDAGGNWSLVLPVACGTRCGAHPALPPTGARMCVLCPHCHQLRSAPWSTCSWHFGPAPQDIVPGRSADSSGRTPEMCARTRTEQTPVGPRRVRTVRCYCSHVSYLISPAHFYLSSFKYNNW